MVEQAAPEVDYEALPTGAGYGINMLAGALVCALPTLAHQRQAISPPYLFCPIPLLR